MHQHTTLFTCILALTISAGAWAGSDRTATDPQDKARAGFIMLEERLVFVLADQPQMHMTSALEKVQQDDRRGAAEELRVAADYIEMQKARVDDDDAGQMLAKRSDKMRELADKVEQGEVTDAAKLHKSFAKTSLTLAKHHNNLASKHLEKERFVAAGHDVAAASRSLKQAMAWHGELPSDELAILLENAGHVADNLRTEAVGQQLERDNDGARLAGAQEGPGDPRQETTPAQAKNIAEHARSMTEKLGEKIDELAERLESPERDDANGNQDDGDDKND